MTKTQHFSSPTVDRINTYDEGAFVCVDVYASSWAGAPVTSRYFGGHDFPGGLFAARSEAAAWVAKTMNGVAEIIPGATANMAW